MSIITDNERNIIPRWRESAAAAHTGEIAPVTTRATPIPRAEEVLNDRLNTWSATRSNAIGGEILGASLFTTAHQQEVLQVASAIWSSPTATRASKSLAKQVLARYAAEQEQEHSTHSFDENTSTIMRAFADQLRRERQDDDAPEPGAGSDQCVILHQRIHDLKYGLREDPRNALASANIALLYTRLAQLEKAIAAMDNAVYLAPDNRFILRSAVRFHIHRERPDAAQAVLLRSDATQHDPWLLAAEIATASSMKKTGIFVKDGRNAITAGRYTHFHTAELASALGTLELNAGNNRAAKKLFAQSLKIPTENAVAQARWASSRSGFTLSAEQLHTPHSHEARAWNYYYNGDWGNALHEANAWMDDQSFSSRPAIMASYIASEGLADYETAAEIAQRGLLANPTAPNLINNYVFSLANTGKLQEAKQKLDTILTQEFLDQLKPDEHVAIVATAGLVAYRLGDIVHGREYYQTAVRQANAANLNHQMAAAAIHLAIEEIRADSPTAPDSYRLALAASQSITAKAIKELLKRLETLRESQTADPIRTMAHPLF